MGTGRSTGHFPVTNTNCCDISIYKLYKLHHSEAHRTCNQTFCHPQLTNICSRSKAPALGTPTTLEDCGVTTRLGVTVNAACMAALLCTAMGSEAVPLAHWAEPKLPGEIPWTYEPTWAFGMRNYGKQLRICLFWICLNHLLYHVLSPFIIQNYCWSGLNKKNSTARFTAKAWAGSEARLRGICFF